MRVLVASWGSRGDCQPYLAVAQGFARAGHDVRFAGNPLPSVTSATNELGVPFVPLASLTPVAADELITLMSKVRSGLRRSRREIDLFLLRHAEQLYEESREVVAWSDVVVGHNVQPIFRIVAESLGRPFVAGMLNPPILPTAYQPPAGFPDLGPRLNPLSWRVACALLEFAGLRGINELRSRFGLPRLRNLAVEAFASPGLNVVALSPRVLPRPSDCPAGYQWSGYWFLERPGWSPPPAVAAFVNSKPKPIAISFTSAGEFIPASAATSRVFAMARARRSHLALAAVARSGVRAVVYDHWFGLPSALPAWLATPRSLPETILVAGDVPHAWLFPRVAAVVHHGGVGTTAAAFRAGVPAIVVPGGTDQPFWGATAHRLGVAPPPIPDAELSSASLTQAIRAAVSDAGMRERAEALGAAIRQEDGVGTGVRLVESHLCGCAAAQPHALAER